VVLIFTAIGKCLLVITGIQKHDDLGVIRILWIYTGIVKCYSCNMASTTVSRTFIRTGNKKK
jgi:hypothetical protein